MNSKELVNFLHENDISYQVANDSTVIVTFSGTHRKTITVVCSTGQRYLRMESFIARNPDENHQAVYRWLLEQNVKIPMACYCVDQFGDIYLRSSMLTSTVTSDVLDQVLGVFARNSEESFNVILELGFRQAIEREWAWRTSRGMSTENLEAFSHLINELD